MSQRLGFRTYTYLHKHYMVNSTGCPFVSKSVEMFPLFNHIYEIPNRSEFVVTCSLILQHLLTSLIVLVHSSSISFNKKLSLEINLLHNQMLFFDQQRVATTFPTTQDFTDKVQFEVWVQIRRIHISFLLCFHYDCWQRFL